jgi:uncharacterized membrane protein YciS (DUF1049 family)
VSSKVIVLLLLIAISAILLTSGVPSNEVLCIEYILTYSNLESHFSTLIEKELLTVSSGLPPLSLGAT